MYLGICVKCLKIEILQLTVYGSGVVVKATDYLLSRISLGNSSTYLQY